MTDLITFLRDRFDEDEQAARQLDEQTRALAEVDAKRQILARVEDDASVPSAKCQAMSRDQWSLVLSARDVLKLLALPYADHPDYPGRTTEPATVDHAEKFTRDVTTALETFAREEAAERRRWVNHDQ